MKKLAVEQNARTAELGQLSCLEICSVFILGILIVITLAFSYLGRLGPIELILFSFLIGLLLIGLSIRLIRAANRAGSSQNNHYQMLMSMPKPFSVG